MTIFDPFIFLARAHQVNFLELCSDLIIVRGKIPVFIFAAYGGFCLLIKSIYFFYYNQNGYLIKERK